MFKIGPKIQGIKKNCNRYIYKNTVRAKYNRNMDITTFAGIATGIQVFRMPSWQAHDFGITAMLGTLTYGNLTLAIKNFIKLQPIRQRAIKIKKAAKLNNKLKSNL